MGPWGSRTLSQVVLQRPKGAPWIGAGGEGLSKSGEWSSGDTVEWCGKARRLIASQPGDATGVRSDPLAKMGGSAASA